MGAIPNRLVVLLVIVLSAAGPGLSETPGGFRLWTSVTGKTLDAEFVGLQSDRVTLKTKDGRTLQIGLEQLSPADQAVIRRSASSTGPATPPPPAVVSSARGPALPKLSVQGAKLIDPAGNAVILRGCNLGNWLLIEPWMLCLNEGDAKVADQQEIEAILSAKFGEAEKDKMLDLYRESWMSRGDFKVIRDFGMNVVRLPLDHELFESDANPMQLRERAFDWVDRAVDMAEAAALYVILDMHGAPGGQSEADHTGHKGKNELWTSDSDQQRLAWLWTQIATRYKDRAAVVAYDMLNEPWGAPGDRQAALAARLYDAIRAGDPEKLIFLPGARDGFDHYGDLAARGWRNVGLTAHYYPGLFEGDGSLGGPGLSHERHIARMEEVAREMQARNVPFLVGEMNVVSKKAGGAALMRHYFDLYARCGFHTTMWSYKVVSRNGGVGEECWGLVTNSRPAEQIDLHKAISSMSVKSYLRHFANEKWVVYDELRRMLTAKNPALPALSSLLASNTRNSR